MQAWKQFLLTHLQNYKTLVNELYSMADTGEDSLHVALSLLQTLGELMILLEENDSIIAGQFQSSARKWKEASTPLTRFRALYLEPEIDERLDDVLIQLEKSNCCLLVRLCLGRRDSSVLFEI